MKTLQDITVNLELARKPIPNYEGIYSINKFGEIISEVRRRIDGRIYKAKILKTYTRKDGYVSVFLYKNNVARRFYVHRLVAESFIPNPEKHKTVNHKDGNKSNNCVENLEWCSYSYNIKHAFTQLGRRVWNKGLKTPRILGVCGWCGKRYEKKRKLQRFCGVTCSSKYRNNLAKNKIIKFER